MSKRSTTFATFTVRIKVPTGLTPGHVQNYLNDAIGGWKGGMSPSPFDNIDFSVAITKKETTYGPA